MSPRGAHADVYDRLTAPGKKPSLMTLVVTQFISGLWHGVFAGYALMFISCAFFFHSSKVRAPPWGSEPCNLVPCACVGCSVCEP